jgi:hypothetical protein
LEGCLVGWVEAGGSDGGLVAVLGVELAEVFADGDEAVEAGGIVEFLAHDFVGGLFDAGVVEDGFEDVLHGLFGMWFVEVGGALMRRDVGAVRLAAAGHADVRQGSGEVVGDE